MVPTGLIRQLFKSLLPRGARGPTRCWGALLLTAACGSSEPGADRDLVPSQPCDTVVPDSLGSVAAPVNALLLEAHEKAIAICVTEPGAIDAEIHLAAGQTLKLAPGVYDQSATIYLAGVGPGLFGDGFKTTHIIARPEFVDSMVKIEAYADGYQILGLDLSRQMPSTTETAIGISSGKTNNYGLLRDLFLSRHHRGLRLGPTGWSRIEDVAITDCTADAILFTNAMAVPNPSNPDEKLNYACQYHLRSIYLGSNGGAGIVASPDQHAMCVGNWDSISTWNNQGPAIHTIKVGDYTVEALRVSNSFFGMDSRGALAAEVVLDGGSGHMFANTYIELAGRKLEVGDDGPSWDKAASGLILSTTTGRTQLSNVTIVGSGGSGIQALGKDLLLNTVTISANGRAGEEGRKSGLVLGPAANATVMSSQFIAGGTQEIGIESYSTSLAIVGCSFVGTQTALFGVDASAIVQVGNTGL